MGKGVERDRERQRGREASGKPTTSSTGALASDW